MTVTQLIPSMTDEVTTRSIEDTDRNWIESMCKQQWGTSVMISRGRQFDIAKQAGLIADVDGERSGFLTYEVVGDECEVGGLLSLTEGKRVGSALLKAGEQYARSAGCKRFWLITTNDNLDGLRFYQKRGFELVSIYRGAVNETRRQFKPGIPVIGENGIPLRDEIELEIRLR